MNLSKGAMHLIGGGGLEIEKVQPVYMLHGSSVHCWAYSGGTVTVEEADPEKSFFITNTNNWYQNSSDQLHFRWKQNDATTAAMESMYCASCNFCWNWPIYGELCTLKSKPRKMQHVTGDAFPITVEETDPDKTLIFRACGIAGDVHLTDSTTLDVKQTTITGSTAYYAGYYLILP